MKKSIKIVIFLIITLVLLGSFSFADEYYTIKNYDVKIDVTEDNIYHIVETIEVFFSEPRHGIFRDIPTSLYGYNHKISDVKVIDPITGTNYKYDVSNEGSNIKIKIGDADVYVNNQKTYLIEYTYNAGDDLIKEYDEFYFNIIGTQWDTPIDRVTFQINMPKSFDSSRLNVTAGYYGATTSENVNFVVNGNTISGTVSNLFNYQGVTVALNLDEGYYENVKKPFSMVWIYLLIIVLILLLGSAIYIKSSNYRGNTIIPILNFYSPKELNPAEIAYIFKEESLSNNDMSSLIIYWASKGYLKIYEVEKSGIFSKESMYFERLVDPSVLGNGYEMHLFNGMFNHGDGTKVTSDDLKYEFHTNLDTARGFVRDNYRGDKEILINKFQYGIVIVSILIALFTSSILSIYTKVLIGIPYLLALGFTFLFLFIFWLIGFIIAKRHKSKIGKYKFLKIIKYIVLIFIFGNIIFAFKDAIMNIDLSNAKFGSLTILMIISVVLYIITVFTISKIKRYTKFAKDLLNNIYGFKDFLETAKLDKLEMLFEENPEYFYDMLPYVMVFDLSKIWDKHVKTLTLEGPSWYVSNRPFTAYYMMNSFNHSFTEMAAAPSSSSSGGGGSVGGGGGGGGGGSW